MDVKAFPALIVGVVVALVLAGAVLPVFAETTSATDTFKNEGYFRMAKYTSSDEFSATWDYNNTTQITINGVVEQLPASMNVLGVSIILGDNYYLRYVPRDSAITLYYDGVGIITASPDTNTGMTITMDEDSILFQLTGGATTSRDVTTLTDFYAVKSDGAYIMKDAEKPAYLNGDSVIYGCGRTSYTNNILGTLVTGNIDDGVTVDYWRTSVDTTSSDITVNSSEVTSYKDLYKFESVTFHALYTYDNVDYDQLVTYSYVVVPYEVTAEKAVHPDGALSVMLNVLPLLAIAGLVTGAVVWFIVRKR